MGRRLPSGALSLILSEATAGFSRLTSYFKRGFRFARLGWATGKDGAFLYMMLMYKCRLVNPLFYGFFYPLLCGGSGSAGTSGAPDGGDLTRDAGVGIIGRLYKLK